MSDILHSFDFRKTQQLHYQGGFIYWTRASGCNLYTTITWPRMR